MMETNEVFCKIFQKDILNQDYIYMPDRDDILESCNFEIFEDYTKRYESLGRIIINKEIIIDMEGYSYYLHLATEPKNRFKLLGVDNLLMDIVRINGSENFMKQNYQALISFSKNLREIDKEKVFQFFMSFVLNNKKSVKELHQEEQIKEDSKIKQRLWIAIVASWILVVACYCVDYYIFHKPFIDDSDKPIMEYKNGISNHSWAK